MALIVLILALILQKYTAFGRHVYAIGENENIAVMVGIKVNKIKVPFIKKSSTEKYAKS